MNKEEKIKAIYEKIADKTLSFGCRIDYDYLWDWIKQKWKLICIDENSKRTNYRIFFDKFNWRDLDSITHKWLFDIIWHPVMIWRCDLLIEKWPDYFDEWILILDLWEDKDKPIENQSERCIDHIYNLTLVSWK